MAKYSYGWHPSPPDIRDVLYSAPHYVVAALPPKVDLVDPALPPPWNPIYDQKSIGSCGPHSETADLVYSALKQQKLPSCPMPSRLFIYYCARMVMGTVGQDSGVDNRSMLKALAQYGWCDEALWPYNTDYFTVKPPQKCFDQAAERKIIQYLSVPQTLDQMRGCLASGDPFIFGFTVYASLESPEVARTGIVPMPQPQLGDVPVGGHDVLMVGYDSATQRFKFRNSWGPTWGDHGYGYIPYAYATHPRLAGDFWTVRSAGLPQPAPEPIPPPIPIPIPPQPPEPGLYMYTYVFSMTDATNLISKSTTVGVKINSGAQLIGYLGQVVFPAGMTAVAMATLPPPCDDATAEAWLTSMGNATTMTALPIDYRALLAWVVQLMLKLIAGA